MVLYKNGGARGGGGKGGEQRKAAARERRPNVFFFFFRDCMTFYVCTLFEWFVFDQNGAWKMMEFIAFSRYIHTLFAADVVTYDSGKKIDTIYRYM